MAGGRPKNSKEVAGKIRWIVDKALELLETKSGVDAAEMLCNEIIERGLTDTIPKFASFYPKEIHAEVSSISPEEWLERMADARSKSESTEPEATVPGQLH